MYTDFFNLKVKPFELVPNPAFLYQSRSHKKALNYLKYGLHERAGFILLTGEVGSGKTTIVRNIISEIGKDVALSMLYNTKVTNKQVLAMINEDFGLTVTGKDKITLLRNLNDFLVSIHAQNRRAVVIIDEAQNLSTSALEEIRLLSNVEATNAKLLQIVLVGQPELKKTIAHYELRQLRQRISVHAQIDPLTRSETEDYVYYRLETAGNRSALVWGEGTFDVLFKYSHGIPRLVNVFCDFILLAACVEGTNELNLEFVHDVLGEVSWDKHVAEHAEENKSSLQTLPRQRLVEQLSIYDQKLAALEALLSHRDEINHELRVQKELLTAILEIQDLGFRRMEEGLDRTCHYLEMYLTGNAAKEDADFKTSEIDDHGSQSKGLLRKLFS
jgi:putative secretion ATPase (PEP-CTERM system associated)